jgi:hypothetical protein
MRNNNSVFLVGVYLLAIAAANISLTVFGPAAIPVNAFLFIGLDLTLRDRLHMSWGGVGLYRKMFTLVVAGGLLSGLLAQFLGDAAWQVALASTIAFVGAGTLDALVFGALSRTSYGWRVNASNAAGALADSILFPVCLLLAFGAPVTFMAVFTAFAAKAAGGFFWWGAMRIVGYAPTAKGVRV